MTSPPGAARVILTSRGLGCRGWEAGCPRRSRRWCCRLYSASRSRRSVGGSAGALQQMSASDVGQTRRRRSSGKPGRRTVSGVEGRRNEKKRHCAWLEMIPRLCVALGGRLTAQGNCCRMRRARSRTQGVRTEVQAGGRWASRELPEAEVSCVSARGWLHC